MGGGFREQPPEYCTVSKTVKKDIPMILSLCVSLNEIVEQGRDFPWPREAVPVLSHNQDTPPEGYGRGGR